MSEELKLTPGQTLAFFASVIKSGEPWTGTCQKAYDEAMAALSSPRVEDVRREALEEAAKVVEPTNGPPCDCITLHDDEWWMPRCDCRNGGDADEAQSWCTSKNEARRIRALSPPVG